MGSFSLFLGVLGFSIVFILAGITASIMLTNMNYNTNPFYLWILVGGVSSSSATFRIRRNRLNNNGIRFVVSTDPEHYTSPVYETSIFGPHEEKSRYHPLVYSISLDDGTLEPNTRYYYCTHRIFDDTTTATATARDLNNTSSASTTADAVAQQQQLRNITVESWSIIARGTFETPGFELVAQDFSFAAAACAYTGSDHDVYRKVVDHNPLFLLHLGDFHYEDINRNDMQLRINAMDLVMGSASQRELYHKLPLVYMYDDHDWLGDNSGQMSGADVNQNNNNVIIQSSREEPVRYNGNGDISIAANNNGNGNGNNNLFVQRGRSARETALLSYQTIFPHYPLGALNNSANTAADADNNEQIKVGVPNYHAFTIGTVRFIVSDLRSEANDESIMSPTQRQWLRRELLQAANNDLYDFVIWVSTRPWIARDGGHDIDDTWYKYPNDRRELSNFISATFSANKQNLFMISGDAHMIALDDGRHSYFGNDTTSALSFPVLQTAPFDRTGSTRGGPYSDGCYAYSYERIHQYSIISFQQQNDELNDGPCLKVTSYDANGRIILEKTMCGQIFTTTTTSTSTTNTQEEGGEENNEDVVFEECQAEYASVTSYVTLGVSLALLLVITLLLIICKCRCCGSETCPNMNLGDASICLTISVICTLWIGYAVNLFASYMVPMVFKNVPQVDLPVVLLILTLQMIVILIYVIVWMFFMK